MVKINRVVSIIKIVRDISAREYSLNYSVSSKQSVVKYSLEKIKVTVHGREGLRFAA